MENYFKHKMRGKSPGAIAGMVIGGGIIMVLIAVVVGYIFMSLWNWLVPELFGLPTLTYWKAVGLFILFKLIFGMGSGHGSSSKSSKKKRSGKCGNNDKSNFSKWDLYDDFWKEEGEAAYERYVEAQNNPRPQDLNTKRDDEDGNLA